MSGNRPPSREEEDLRERSTKKVKGGEHPFTNESTAPIDYSDIYEDMEKEEEPIKRSYKATVLGITGEDMEGTSAGTGNKEPAPDYGKFHVGNMNLQIIEKKHAGFDCPEIVIPSHAEERLARPWKQGLIVNLLGRRIGFKALENRLNQMWVKKGVMNIVNLGCDFFLVYLTSQEDYEKALSNGPWLIYDHYLIIREWRPNFRPEKEEVERVAAWVRLPELPIEYYDSDFLFFLGNRIGRTVKVDQTTSLTTRGQYARLCVEVDLNKPLLAMFELKGHIYRIEYEGLHLLCMACGKFGHHRDHCKEQVTPGTNGPATSTERQPGTTDQPAAIAPENGPWRIVQKPRMPRKQKDKVQVVSDNGRQTPVNINGPNQLGGSRFNVLAEGEENLDQNSNDELIPTVMESAPIIVNHAMPASQERTRGQQPKQIPTRAARKSGAHLENSANLNATGRVSREAAKTVTHVGDSLEVDTRHVRGTVHANHIASRRDHQASIGTTISPLIPPKIMDLDIPKPNTGGPIGPHPTRPPDPNGVVTFDTPNSTRNSDDVGMIDSEEFMDAHEQGEITTSDSEMEVVLGTPHP